MKILVLSKKFPYPLREGEPIAISSLCRALQAKGCVLDLLVLNTSKHFFDPAGLPSQFNFFRQIHSVKTDNHITWRGALASLLKGESYILSRFRSEAFSQKLKALLAENDYDAVQLETLYMAHYIPDIRAGSRAIIAMRAHNVEHEIWQRYAELTPHWLKKWYLRLQNKSLRDFEKKQLREYDLMIAITGRDLDVFHKMGYRNAAVTAPVGIDLDDYVPDYQCFDEKKISIAFIGALDWMPNQDGVVWFLDKVWPAVSAAFPKVEFHIAGKNTPDWLFRRAGGGVFVHGEVEDARRFINDHPIMVAPLFSGSGIKIKVLEGMALARAVITTPVGLEGIPARKGEQVFVAETPQAFARQLVFCIENIPAIRDHGKMARHFIKTHFDNMAIAEDVVRAYQRCLKDRATG